MQINKFLYIIKSLFLLIYKTRGSNYTNTNEKAESLINNKEFYQTSNHQEKNMLPPESKSLNYINMY
jgi:hypothetical protein